MKGPDLRRRSGQPGMDARRARDRGTGLRFLPAVVIRPTLPCGRSTSHRFSAERSPQAVPSAGRNVGTCDESAFAVDVLLSGIGSFAHAPKLIALIERPHAGGSTPTRSAVEAPTRAVSVCSCPATSVLRLVSLPGWHGCSTSGSRQRRLRWARCRAISVESSRAAECSAGSAIETEHWLT